MKYYNNCNMSELRQKTIDTYNRSARELAEYFRGIGPRAKYVDLALEFAGNPDNPRIVEIGCGDGRDSSYITQKAGWYMGFDVSEEFIKLARNDFPNTHFEVADAVHFEYPDNLDVVFAFASILHLSPTEVKSTLEKVATALRPGGVFYISSKHADAYREEIKNDKFGTRLFHLYNPENIAELAGDDYEILEHWQEIIGKTTWFEMALQKRKPLAG
jgi:SAM-dependent methyltransferase